jgi:hypothetical protein
VTGGSRHDAVGAVVWVVAGAVILGWAATFPFGSLKAPGPGLLPFACGGALVVLGAVLFVQARGRVTPPAVSLFADRAALGRMAATLAAIVAAALLIERAGFTATVFALTLFLLAAVARLSWPASIGYAVAAAVACVVLFQRVLGVELPRGWLGF